MTYAVVGAVGSRLETAADAALYEAFVSPRYDALFSAPLIGMATSSAPARIAHLACRTGQAGLDLAARVPTVSLRGVDPSEPALALAKAKAIALGFSTFSFVCERPGEGALASGAFTHGVLLNPAATYGTVARGLAELHRVLSPGGQALVAVPLCGSFPELYDLLREYGVRYGDDPFVDAVDRAQSSRPTPEEFEAMLEASGFDDVAVAVELAGIGFPSGAAFAADPLSRLVLAPELASSFAEPTSFVSAYAYAAEAVARYFNELPFRLTFNVGCAGARRRT